MGDEVDGEVGTGDLVDGERGAIERNRPLLGNVGRKPGGRGKPERDGIALLLQLRHRGDTVGVTEHQVTAKLVADPERALEIDRRAGPPATERGACQRLSRDIDRETTAAARIGTDLDHRQTDAGTGDRGTDGDSLRFIVAGYG